MKKKFVLIYLILFVICFSLIFNKYLNVNKNVVVNKENNVSLSKEFELISMMLEQNYGTGDYKETTLGEFPSDGYIFNESLSGCENGGNLFWNEEKKKVVLKGNISDKCYAYFDKYNYATVNSVSSVKITSNSITVLVDAVSGNVPISAYLYSIDNGEFMESSSNKYTFSNLKDETTYTIKVKVKDLNEKCSAIYNIQFTTIKTITFKTYLIKIYAQNNESRTGLYKHSSSLTNGAEDNSYRYSGADPDNYVCFGYDSLDGTCPTDNLYRIIGILNTGIKLIKYDYAKSSLLGTDGDYWDTYSNLNGSGKSKGINTKSEIAAYMWNYNDGSRSNIWDTSLLNKTNLNINFLNNIGSKWTNMIKTTIWEVSGDTSDNIQNVVPKTVYQNEVVNSSDSYVSKIGLVYASDYGFAADPSEWTETLWDYNSTSITTANWMYMGLDEWTLTPVKGNSSNVFNIYNYGNLDNSFSTSGFAVRPVFYLNDSVNYISGDGTKELPIIISD